jgi:lipopolysaccharide export system ATP-binding protein
MKENRCILNVSHLGKSYDNKRVIKDISFTVDEGSVVGLLGPNGAGKTTCFYMITGMIPSDFGKVEFDGKDVTDLPMYKRARLGMGYLPQEPSIFRGLNVEDNIMAILEVVEPSYFNRVKRLNDLLAEFSISHLAKVKSIHLSGGERRRLEIARALAANPKFMFLDEPLAGIDPIAVSDIKDLIMQLKKKGISVLITDHNVRDTLNIVDKAYIISEGHILAQGTPSEIVQNKKARSMYLGESFKLD